MPERSVAIVIPVLNEAHTLTPLLNDCAAQRPSAAEVIVVDGGSTDGTWELLNERRSAWPALKVARVAGATPGRGRNEGISRADSEVIATLDAGSRVGPTWLAALTGPLAESPAERVCVGVVEPDARSEFERAAGWLTLRSYKPRDRPALLAGTFLPAGRNGYCFSRRAWEAAGGYPSELRWGEDKVFLQRLRRAGSEIVVAPDAVVRWRPRQSLGEVYRQYMGYGRGDAQAKVDRQNELVTLALYATGVLLATAAARGSGKAAGALVLSVGAYVALFVVPARRELGLTRALAWVPLIRLIADLAKMHGFAAASLGRLLRRA
jgi:glycosyltransferase involved in cell wall biosynthesis